MKSLRSIALVVGFWLVASGLIAGIATALTPTQTVVLFSAKCPSFVPQAGGQCASVYANFANQQYYYNKVTYGDSTSWLTALGGTFTRASTAYYTNSAGLLASAGTNVLRFDYDPTTLAPKGILLEGARTNIALQSQTFDNATWLKQTTPPVSVSADAATAPDGTSTADKLIAATSASSFNYIRLTNLTSSATTYTASVYAKAGGYDYIELILGVPSSYTAFAASYFNLSTGAWVSDRNTTYTVASKSITAVGNGWYRCTLSVAVAASADMVFAMTVGSTSNPTASFTGDGTSGIFLWGAQLEAASFASSYIPTTTGSVTRAADSLQLGASVFSGNAATVLFSFNPASISGSGGTRLYAFVLSGGTNSIGIGNVPFFGASARAESAQGVGSLYGITSANLTAGQTNKIAHAFASGVQKIVANGGTIGSDTQALTISNSTQLAYGTNAYQVMNLSQVALWPQVISNADLQRLTQ